MCMCSRSSTTFDAMSDSDLEATVCQDSPTYRDVRHAATAAATAAATTANHAAGATAAVATAVAAKDPELSFLKSNCDNVKDADETEDISLVQELQREAVSKNSSRVTQKENSNIYKPFFHKTVGVSQRKENDFNNSAIDNTARSTSSDSRLGSTPDKSLRKEEGRIVKKKKGSEQQQPTKPAEISTSDKGSHRPFSAAGSQPLSSSSSCRVSPWQAVAMPSLKSPKKPLEKTADTVPSVGQLVWIISDWRSRLGIREFLTNIWLWRVDAKELWQHFLSKAGGWGERAWTRCHLVPDRKKAAELCRISHALLKDMPYPSQRPKFEEGSRDIDVTRRDVLSCEHRIKAWQGLEDSIKNRLLCDVPIDLLDYCLAELATAKNKPSTLGQYARVGNLLAQEYGMHLSEDFRGRLVEEGAYEVVKQSLKWGWSEPKTVVMKPAFKKRSKSWDQESKHEEETQPYKKSKTHFYSEGKSSQGYWEADGDLASEEKRKKSSWEDSEGGWTSLDGWKRSKQSQKDWQKGEDKWQWNYLQNSKFTQKSDKWGREENEEWPVYQHKTASVNRHGQGHSFGSQGNTTHSTWSSPSPWKSSDQVLPSKHSSPAPGDNVAQSDGLSRTGRRKADGSISWYQQPQQLNKGGSSAQTPQKDDQTGSRGYDELELRQKLFWRDREDPQPSNACGSKWNGWMA